MDWDDPEAVKAYKKAYGKKYWEAHKSSLSAQHSAYCKAHRSTLLAQQKARRAANSEEYRAQQRIYRREHRHQKGLNLPMAENKECSSFLGVHVAENALSKFFDHIERMPYGNTGYDFICGKGFKIDVKSSRSHKRPKRSDNWTFTIKKNKIADYFLCIGFDRDSLMPLHVWLIPGPLVNEKLMISITDSKRSLPKWAKFERSLERVLPCCEKLRE